MEKSNKKEEINLLDILRFLQQKRKNILLSIIASVFVFAGAFFILVKPLYESEAILRFRAIPTLGYHADINDVNALKTVDFFNCRMIPGVTTVPSQTEIVLKLTSRETLKYLNDKVGTNYSWEDMNKVITINTKTENENSSNYLVAILVRHEDSQMAADIANILVDKIIFDLEQQEKNDIQSTIDKLSQEKVNLKERLSKLQSCNEMGYWDFEIQNLQQVVALTDWQIMELLSVQNIYDISDRVLVIADAFPSKAPVSKNWGKIIGGAAVFGFTLAVGVLLLRKYLQES